MNRESRIVIAGLAAHRAARAVALDSITAPLRKRLELWSLEERRGPATPDEPDGPLLDNTIREKLSELVSCPHCIGFWFAGAATLAAVGRRRPIEFALTWWAVAGLQDTLSSVQMAADQAAGLAKDVWGQRRHDRMERARKGQLPGIVAG